VNVALADVSRADEATGCGGFPLILQKRESYFYEVKRFRCMADFIYLTVPPAIVFLFANIYENHPKG
jgi:hypothetical protein